MPVRVVKSSEPQWFLPRVIFDFRHALGTIFFAVGVIISTVVVVFLLTEGGDPFPVLGAVLAVAAMALSALISPPHRTVLFLRKFKTPHARVRQENLLGRELFANWRLISIFDKSAATNPTASWHLSIFLLLWVILAAASMIINYATGVTLAPGIRFIVAVLLTPILDEIVRTQYSRAFNIRVEHQPSVRETAHRVARLSKTKNRIINVPVLSVSTTNDLWRSVVQSVSEEVDLVLMDLSEWGEGILWELEHFAAHPCIKVVVYMHCDAISALDEQASKRNAIAERVKDALQGKEILVYGEPKNYRRFRSMLRSAMIFYSRASPHKSIKSRVQ
jgi:hypothetical protein